MPRKNKAFRSIHPDKWLKKHVKQLNSYEYVTSLDNKWQVFLRQKYLAKKEISNDNPS
jgi:hypothetical protein